jgi:hypothetical protein
MIEHKLEVVGTALNGAEDEWSVDGILTSTVSAESILSGKIDPFIEQIMAHVTGFDERKKKWDTQAERRKAKTSGTATSTSAINVAELEEIDDDNDDQYTFIPDAPLSRSRAKTTTTTTATTKTAAASRAKPPPTTSKPTTTTMTTTNPTSMSGNHVGSVGALARSGALWAQSASSSTTQATRKRTRQFIDDELENEDRPAKHSTITAEAPATSTCSTMQQHDEQPPAQPTVPSMPSAPQASYSTAAPVLASIPAGKRDGKAMLQMFRR